MTQMETYCTKCGHPTRSTTPHCSNCGAADPWDEHPAYEFDPDDLPYIFSYEVYQDNWELWRIFCDEYFGAYELTGEDVTGFPEDFPRLKYCVFDIYFVVTDDLELEGPFVERKDAKAAAGEGDS